MVVEDNGPVIVGVTWFLCFFSGAFLALRLYAKLSRKQGLWWDDHILIAAWVLLLAESAMTHAGQKLGFGKHIADIPPQNLTTVTLGTMITASISCFASTFSKISFGVTLLRLTSGALRIFVWFCIITLFLIMLPSASLTWFQCRPIARTWNSTVEGECWDGTMVVNYGIFNAAWCTVVDFALALLPWVLIWKLTLSTREKLGVGIAMSMGILSGVCAIIKGVYLVQLKDEDFFYNGKDVTIWTAVETATAIIGASIPVLRVFFKNKVSSLYNDSDRSKDTPMSHLTWSRASSRGRSGSGVRSVVEIRGDSESERSILRDEEGRWLGGILQTSTVTVEYEARERDSIVTIKERGDENMNEHEKRLDRGVGIAV